MVIKKNLLTENLHDRPPIMMADYEPAVLVFVCGKLGTPGGEQFMWIL